jgi:hypothetical protein
MKRYIKFFEDLNIKKQLDVKRLNESLHNKSIENEHWKFLSSADCRKELGDKEIVPISEKILLLIKDRFNIKDGMIKDDNELKGHIWIYSYRYDYYICEYEDKWFTVWLSPNPGTMVHNNTKYWVYLCDQLDGLLNFLDFANSENRINYRPEYGKWLDLPIKK